MHVKRLITYGFLVVAATLLVACGNEDDSAPKATAEPTVRVTSTQAVTLTNAMTASPTEIDRSLAVTPDPRTPQIQPTRAAGPVGTPQASPAESSPQATPAAVLLAPTTATIGLDGREQQDYVLTDQGCVGLNEWAQLKPGAQVIVRDASGTVVDIGELQAGAGDGCSWSIDIEIPQDGFFSVSIPMTFETWFESGEAVEVQLP